MVTDVKREQPKNELLPMEMTEEGILTDVKLVQL